MNAFFTQAADTLFHGMKSRDLDIDYLFLDYLFLLEALESGVVPGDEQVATLVQMGLVEHAASGLTLTVEARVKLANLRSLMRVHPLAPG